MKSGYPDVDFDRATLILPYCSTHERLRRSGQWEDYPRLVLDEIAAFSQPVIVEKECDLCQPAAQTSSLSFSRDAGDAL